METLSVNRELRQNEVLRVHPNPIITGVLKEEICTQTHREGRGYKDLEQTAPYKVKQRRASEDTNPANTLI